MSNLLPNLETFLSRIRSHTELVDNITENNGVITIKIKGKYPDYILDDLKVVQPLMKELKLSEYIKRVKTDPVQRQKTAYTFSEFGIEKTTVETCYSIEYQIDVIGIHRDRLRYFFHSGMTQKDACNSIYYLTTQGWNQDQFSEIGVSRATFFRYRDKQPVTASA